MEFIRNQAMLAKDLKMFDACHYTAWRSALLEKGKLHENEKDHSSMVEISPTSPQYLNLYHILLQSIFGFNQNLCCKQVSVSGQLS